MKRKGLGKGVGALFHENTAEREHVTEMKLPLADIEPNPLQPRKHFEEDALLELAESMKNYGVLQPILVQRKDKTYEIITGERRWRAAKIAGLKEIPVMVKEFSEKELAEIALIENIQRENLNVVEEATAYRRLLDEFAMTHDELATRIGKSRSVISNTLRLLDLQKEVQKMLEEDMLSMGHARALLAIKDGSGQIEAALYVFDRQLSVRETENYVKNLNKQKVERSMPKLSPEMKDVERRIAEYFGAKVVLTGKKNGGKIEINYSSMEDLERILDLIGE